MERMGREEILAMYKPDVERLVYFLPWLEGKSGKDVSNVYYADEAHATLSFPVYDEILLTFLNELSSTVFMDQNYRYIYTRYRMHDYKDELRMIEKTDIMSMDILKGIFSKYMLGGMTKANLWIQGIEHQIFLKALQKAKEIVEFWDVPLDVPMMELGNMQEETIFESEPMEEAAPEYEEAWETAAGAEEVWETASEAETEEVQEEAEALPVEESEEDAAEPESEEDVSAELPEPEEAWETVSEAEAEEVQEEAEVLPVEEDAAVAEAAEEEEV